MKINIRELAHIVINIFQVICDLDYNYKVALLPLFCYT